MTHYRWIYLAGAAALLCSFGAVADSSHELCPGCAVNTTSDVVSGTNDQQGEDQDDLNHGKGHQRDDDHVKGHGKGHRGDNDQGNNQQGDDDDQGGGKHGKSHANSGPPISSNPASGNSGTATGNPVISKPGAAGPTGVPEPGTAALLTAGLLGFAVRQLRRRARAERQVQ
jgi:hypothetical protein